MNTTQDEKILRMLDGDLTEVEKEKLQKEIASSPALQARWKELESIHVFLSKRSKIEIPSKTFTQKVMSGLDRAPSRSMISPRNGIYLLLGILVASGLLISLLSSGAFNGLTTTLAVDNPLKNQELISVPTVSIPFDGKTIIKSIIFINLALALVMLDRTILRPLFQHRNEAI